MAQPFLGEIEAFAFNFAPRAGCFWLESRLGFPNQLRSDSTCWLGGGQQGCRSLIRKTCVIA
jgi:hypothetical protein